MSRTFITTTDNPFDHFTQYMAWKNFDEDVCGYYTESYAARIATLSQSMSPGEAEREAENVCDEICAMDLRWISPVTGEEAGYVKVVEKD